MEEIVFKPKYHKKLRLSIVGLSLMLLIGLPLLLKDPPDDVWVTVSFVGLAFMLLAMPFVLIREIRFGDRIQIYRYLLLKHDRPYQDVVDVGLTGFRLGRMHVTWSQLENGEQLAAIVDSLIDKGIIPVDQLRGDQVVEEVSAQYGAVIGGISGVVLAVGAVFLGLVPENMPAGVFGGAVAIGSFLVVYLLYRHVILPRRAT